MRLTLIILLAILFGPVASHATEPVDTLTFTYKLHGQTRRFKVTFNPQTDGSMVMKWDIVRNLKLWTGSYTMTPEAVKSGSALSFIMPEDGNHITLPDGVTFGMISTDALKSLRRDGKMIYNGMTYRVSDREDSEMGPVIHVTEDLEGEQMWILDNDQLPLITRMSDNPLEINWSVQRKN